MLREIIVFVAFLFALIYIVASFTAIQRLSSKQLLKAENAIEVANETY